MQPHYYYELCILARVCRKLCYSVIAPDWLLGILFCLSLLGGISFISSKPFQAPPPPNYFRLNHLSSDGFSPRADGDFQFR